MLEILSTYANSTGTTLLLKIRMGVGDGHAGRGAIVWGVIRMAGKSIMQRLALLLHGKSYQRECVGNII